MSNFSLILFSDIHLGCRPSENQLPVIESFCKDVTEVCKNKEGDKFLFCIGDLVQAADSREQYDEFKTDILDKISESLDIPNEHILLLPGNHDAQKSEIERIKEKRFDDVMNLKSESDFNDYIRSDLSVGYPFENFVKFSKQYKNSKWDDIGFSSFSISDNWNVACLNSAVMTFAHVDERKDSKYLGIDTRSLTEWISENTNSKKILLMHHPLEDLAAWAKEELISLINSNFDIVVTGHTHFQFASSPLGTEVKTIHCQLPHLFHDKSEDAMGYAVIDFQDGFPYQIQYREWNNRRHKFVPGTSFVDDELGILELEASKTIKKSLESASLIQKNLDSEFHEAMKAYTDIPDLKWEERFVSTQPVEANLRISKEDLICEKEIIDFDGDIMILSPRDYGLTCYGLHFAKILWLEHKQISVFIDNPNCKLNRLKEKINSKITLYNISGNQIKWLIIDEWLLSKEKEKEILSFLHESYPEARLLLLSPRSERFFANSDTLTSHKKTQYLYLTPLSRNQIRHFVSSFNRKKFIAEEDILLQRLDNDIRSFNMHRSPMNCINLLYVFGSTFDRNPVNRTEVLERVLNLIFENDTPPIYSTTPDLKDCIRVLGLMSKKMILDQEFNFSRSVFIGFVNEYSIEKDIIIDSEYLFDLLLRNHIIMPDMDRFRFKASYWVYFFAACRMRVDKDFTDYMVKDARYLNYPLILEFFSGLSREENDILRTLSIDLDSIITNVKEKLKIPKGWAPYNLLKVKPSEAQKTRVFKSLDSEIRGSNLPVELKDAMEDIDYDQRKPFHQDVFKILNRYDVGTLMNFIPIVSRVLRNSDYAEKELKRQLLSLIVDAWKILLDSLSLFAPILAIKGHVTLGGAQFSFIDKIEETDPKIRIMHVLQCLPSNILRWFEKDLFSSRNSRLYYNFLNESKSYLSKDLVAALILRQLPDDWKQPITNYVRSLDVNSFYLQDTINTMVYTYTTKPTTDEDASSLKELIRLGFARMHTQTRNLSPKQINRIVPIKDLPPRHTQEDNS